MIAFVLFVRGDEGQSSDSGSRQAEGLVERPLQLRTHHAHEPSRGYRKGIWRDAVRGNQLACAIQRRPQPARRDHHLRRRLEAHGTDWLGLRLADGQGAEARADQRAGRDPGYLTDVSGSLSSPLLPRRGRRLLRVEEERWTKEDTVFIRLRSGRPFGFAGIWSMRHGEKGTRLATCAIATCPPNDLVAKIHNRMPVILPEDARDRWLERSGAASRAQPVI